MLFGSPLRPEISRRGSASPELRNADSNCDEWTTDFTRYGSRPGVFGGIVAPTSAVTVAHYARMFCDAQHTIRPAAWLVGFNPPDRVQTRTGFLEIRAGRQGARFQLCCAQRNGPGTRPLRY